METIAIAVSSMELAQRADRLARARCRVAVDRIPVYPNMYMRYWLPEIGGSYDEYFADPEVMLRSQIYGQKWILENIQSDRVFEPLYVDFQNALDASALGCETVFGEDGMIWVREGWVQTESDLETLRRLEPLDTGLAAQALVYAERMQALCDRYVVRLSDGVEFRPAERVEVNLGAMGPFTVAAELAGLAELCEGLYLRPEFSRRLLEIVTDQLIGMLEFTHRRQRMNALWLADDYAANLSPHLFCEYVLPCLKRIRRHFRDLPLRFHMCGQVDHLIPMLAHDLAMDEFNMFGYQVDKALVQREMGGRIVLMGNVNPMNIHSGTPASVFEESLVALDAFGRGPGGFILSDGANIPPGSPTGNINAMWQGASYFAEHYSAR